MKVAGIILAAGSSTRMGKDKLLLKINGEPLLRRVVKMALASDISRVFVVVPEDAKQRLEVINDLDVTIVISTKSSEGMGATMTVGMNAIRAEYTAVTFLLADMPDVVSADVNKLIGAYSGGSDDIIRAISVSGRAGHPVLFGVGYFEQLKILTGDQGAKTIVADNLDRVIGIRTNGEGAIVDLDTPDDLEKWRG